LILEFVVSQQSFVINITNIGLWMVFDQLEDIRKDRVTSVT
jgi:hypothetical protein